MGKVFKAYDTALGRNVAIKILPPELTPDRGRVNRFLQEARAASALNHPHVVAVYDVGEARLDEESGDVRYLAMELVEGRSLRELLAEGPVDLKKAAKIGMQVADALAAAHAAGIVHRDLKPENVMIAANGYAKVLDFGLAKLRVQSDAVDPAGATETMVLPTDPGTVMGTAGYMSPEQAEGRAVDHRSDIFSAGCVLYELVTGRRAFRGNSPVDTMHRIIHDEPEPVRQLRAEILPELTRIIRKAMAKDPDQRYQTAKDLAIDLGGLLRELDSGSSEAVSLPAVAGRRALRRWIPIAAGVAFAVVLAAVVAVSVSRGREGTAATAEAEPLRVTRVTASGRVIAAAISPDGKLVAFVHADQGEQNLRLRQVATGRTLELTPPTRDGYWGLAFSPDASSIYFGMKGTVVPPAGAMYRIPVLGGQPQHVLDGMDSGPAFSPDGKRMAYLRARFPSEAESAVMVANADGTGARVLVSARVPDLFAPLFFAAPSWSPDGRTIATPMLRANSGQARIVMIDVGSGRMRTLVDRGKGIGQVAWLPDQSGLVAVGKDADEENAQVWHVAFPGGEVRPVTRDLFDYRMVTLTADGRSILTIASESSSDIWEVADGAPPRQLTEGIGEGRFGISVAPDGRIVYTSLESGKLDLWIMNPDGSGRALLTRDAWSNRRPVVTPDGRYVVYLSATPVATEVCRMNLDGSGRKALARATLVSPLTVSPDGKWVAFEAGFTAAFSSVGRVSIDGGAAEQLTPLPAACPAYSPDGRRIAMYLQEGSAPYRIAVLPAAGGEPLARIDAPPVAANSALVWEEGGEALVANTGPGDRANLWRFPIDGSPPSRLTDYQERSLFAFAPLRARKGWLLSRGVLSRDAVLIRGFRR